MILIANLKISLSLIEFIRYRSIGWVTKSLQVAWSILVDFNVFLLYST